MKDPNISPHEYILLYNCQPTSISMERSFSVFSNMNCDNRTFKEENIEKYFVLYYVTPPRDYAPRELLLEKIENK